MTESCLKSFNVSQSSNSETGILTNLDPHFKDVKGDTLLHKAVWNGDLELVKSLDEKNANLECVNNSGQTPLHLAVIQEYFEIVEYLVEKNVNLECVDCHGSTPLHLASIKGNLAIVKYFAEKNVNLKCKDKSGWRPVHLASWYGNLEVLKYLCEKRVNLECKDVDGLTPLHKATIQGKLEIVKYLVSKNVNLESKNNDGKTAFHLAIINREFEIVKYFAKQRNYLECTDNEGLTPLHLAAYHHKWNILEYLAGQDANLNCTDMYGRKPIHKLAENGDYSIVKYLACKSYHDIECTDNDGQTPLHRAALYGNLDAVRYLTEQFANMNCTDDMGRTPIDLAIENNKTAVAIYLRSITFRLPIWGKKMKRSDIENIIETRIDKATICKFSDNSQLHFLTNPIQLPCGHNVCYKCIVDKLSQNSYQILFCCLNYVRKFLPGNLLQYKKYEMVNAISNLREYLDSLSTTLLKSCEIIETKMQSLYVQFEFYDEEVDIRFECLNNELELINSKLDKKIKKLRKSCKIYLRSAHGTESDIYKLQALCNLKNLHISSILPLKKDFGVIRFLRDTHDKLDINAHKNYQKMMKLAKVIYKFDDTTPISDKAKPLSSLWETIKQKAELQEMPDVNILKEVEILIICIKTNEDMMKLISIINDVCKNIFYSLFYSKKKIRYMINETENQRQMEKYFDKIREKLFQQFNHQFIETINGELTYQLLRLFKLFTKNITNADFDLNHNNPFL